MSTLLLPDDDPPRGLEDVRGQALNLDAAVGVLVRLHSETFVRQVIVEKEDSLRSSQSVRYDIAIIGVMRITQNFFFFINLI